MKKRNIFFWAQVKDWTVLAFTVLVGLTIVASWLAMGYAVSHFVIKYW